MEAIRLEDPNFSNMTKDPYNSRFLTVDNLSIVVVSGRHALVRSALKTHYPFPMSGTAVEGRLRSVLQASRLIRPSVLWDGVHTHSAPEPAK
jgi:hypothetical protein